MSNVTALFKPPPQPHTAFDDFWAVYPKKAAKGDARRAWQMALRVALAEEIIAGAVRYAKLAEPPYIKHPATWLRGECWADQDNTPAPVVDPQESRLSMKANMVKKADGSKFCADWVKTNVTPEDLATLRERGMI